MSAMTSGGMALTAYQDASATGTLVIHRSATASDTYPVVLKSKGTKLFRQDIQKPSGTTSYVLDYPVTCVNVPQGNRHGIYQNAVSRRVDNIPALSLLAEYADTDKQVQYAGLDTVNGAPAAVVAISFQPPVLPQSTDSLSVTQHMYWIDQSTGYVVKVRYKQFGENGPLYAFVAEDYFSDYRNIGGLMVPFASKTYLDGVLDHELTLSSVTLNTGLLDSDFALPCEVANAH